MKSWTSNHGWQRVTERVPSLDPEIVKGNEKKREVESREHQYPGYAHFRAGGLFQR